MTKILKFLVLCTLVITASTRNVGCSNSDDENSFESDLNWVTAAMVAESRSCKQNGIKVERCDMNFPIDLSEKSQKQRCFILASIFYVLSDLERRFLDCSITNPEYISRVWTCRPLVSELTISIVSESSYCCSYLSQIMGGKLSDIKACVDTSNNLEQLLIPGVQNVLLSMPDGADEESWIESLFSLSEWIDRSPFADSLSDVSRIACQSVEKSTYKSVVLPIMNCPEEGKKALISKVNELMEPFNKKEP